MKTNEIGSVIFLKEDNVKVEVCKADNYYGDACKGCYFDYESGCNLNVMNDEMQNDLGLCGLKRSDTELIIFRRIEE